MRTHLSRTNQTELSNDELIIFDLIFDLYYPIISLKKGENVTVGLNYPISHNLETSDLVDTIERLESKGLLKYKLSYYRKLDKINPLVTLTEAGGKLWEKERHPIWEKYVTECSYEKNGGWYLSIFSPSLETAKRFLKVAQECQLYVLEKPDDFQVIESQGVIASSHITWKSFSNVYEIRAKLLDEMFSENPPHRQTNWKLYKSKLSWWRDVPELQQLKNKSI